MAKLKLTDAGVRSLSTEKAQEDFWDRLTPGLCVRVSGKTGRKTFYVRYRAGVNGNGKHRRMKLGRYPAMSLADAREEARIAQSKAEDGEDPARERRERREGGHTFKDLAREVLDAKRETTRESTWKERDRILATYLLPEWETMPAGDVSRRDVRQLGESIAKGGSPVMANRVVALVKLIYNEGLDREFPGVEANPAHRLKIREEKRRRRFLDRDEIKAVWKATEPENPITKAIFRLTLLTAARVGSVCALRWSDIDDAHVWTIPAEEFKGRRRHMVPLSSEARAVLDELRPLTGDNEFAFPGRSDGDQAEHVVSMNKALRRIRKRSKLSRWTIHDFRRTFRTHATRSADPDHPNDPKGLGVEPHVADAVLGHKEASLGFDRYTAEPERYLLAEKRDALEKWGAFVREAVEVDQ